MERDEKFRGDDFANSRIAGSGVVSDAAIELLPMNVNAPVLSVLAGKKAAGRKAATLGKSQLFVVMAQQWRTGDDARDRSSVLNSVLLFPVTAGVDIAVFFIASGHVCSESSGVVLAMF